MVEPQRHGFLLASGLGLALWSAVSIMGCASQAPLAGISPSATIVVQRGQTLSEIAREYRVSVAQLMQANGISDPRHLLAGQTLFIPGVSYARRIAVRARDQRLQKASIQWPQERADRHFDWPVEGGGSLSSGFGLRDGVMHDGIDICARSGTPVRAAGSGKVIYCGWIRGYGNVIIIRHSGDYVTVYGHNKVNLVHVGESVARDQIIAELGESGRATRPNLHFEVRHDNQAENPLLFLNPPPSNQVTFASNTGS